MEFLPWCSELRIHLQWLGSQGGAGSIPGPAQCGKGPGIAAAVAGIQSLTQELPCAVVAAIKEKKKKKFSKTIVCWKKMD